jgi:hypothetical protein
MAPGAGVAAAKGLLSSGRSSDRGIVRGLLFRVFVSAALVAVVVVPAASAQSAGARVRLSVLPLPASSLGSAAKSLPLQRDSGAISKRAFSPPRFP